MRVVEWVFWKNAQISNESKDLKKYLTHANARKPHFQIANLPTILGLLNCLRNSIKMFACLITISDLE